MAVFLSVALCLSIFAPAAYGAGGPSAWASAEVDSARAANLVIGDADDNFQAEITRGLFCRMIVNMVEETVGTSIDVEISNPFYDTEDTAIVKAFQMGIVKGTSSTEFAPDAFITREQVAVMMMRAARKLDELTGMDYEASADANGITFADEAEISSWAIKDIKKANSLEVMNGVGFGRIDPLGTTTIEQSILLAYRLHNAYVLSGQSSGSAYNRAPTAKADPYVGSDFKALKTYDNMRADELAEDPDNDELIVVSVNGQTGTIETDLGMVVIKSDGTASYTSRAVNKESKETLEVTVSDGRHTAVVNVLITVIP